MSAKHLIKLQGVVIGVYHVALRIQKYEMSLRDYLEVHRDFRHLGKMLLMVIEGLKELHELGYVHRDLKPDNIAINLKPLQVVVIDFDTASPRTQVSKGSVLETPGYMPKFGDLRDGNTRWDVWALAATILEADMEPGAYRTASNERGSVLKAEAHIKEPETSGNLLRLLNLLRSKDGLYGWARTLLLMSQSTINSESTKYLELT